MKVFLSSTYLDLIEHRKEAAEALARLGHHVIGMETFNARTEDPTKASLSEVDECNFFVGIYAHRYGSIIKDAGISVTEQEFDRAVETGKDIFAFFVNEDYPWPPKWVDKDAAQIKKLNDFKAKVVNNATPDYFTDKTNLAYKIVAAIKSHIGREEFPSLAFGRGARGEGLRGEGKPRGSTLPPQSSFFGRAKELDIIKEALAPESRTWGALIDGPGGIGKTALAIRAAHLAPESLFERKIFITAKVRELRPEGEAPLTDFTRADYLAMLNELALELDEPGIVRLAPEARADALRLALAGKKALIILDNLETLPEDERTRLFQFLSRLPAGNKAIVTSRRRADVDARIVRLDLLARDEALQLIADLAGRYPRLGRATLQERGDLYEITQGNPLLIRWIAGQLGRAGSQCHTLREACAFIDKAPKGNDPLEYIFGDLLETFTTDETKVLAALTYFSLPAKLQWIADMTTLRARAAETALEDLTDRSILTSDLSAQTYFLPPLTAKFIRTRRPEAVTQTGDALTDRAYALAMQYGGHDNYAGFKTLDAEWTFLAAALPRLLAGENDRLQAVCAQLDRFLDFTGRWDERLWLTEGAESRALAAGDKNKAGWRAYQAGMTYYSRNQPDEVLACAARAATHWEDAAPRQKAIAIRLRGVGHELQKDYPAAIAAYREVLEIRRALSAESDDVASALNDLAGAERANQDYASAERDYREALRIAKKNNNQEGIAIYTGNLAELALDREQWAQAEALARAALALDEKVGRQELIAADCHSIAKALLHQNRANDEALTLSRRAVEIYTRLRSGDLPAAQETLAEIEKAIQENRE